jgi:hypothetical protein
MVMIPLEENVTGEDPYQKRVRQPIRDIEGHQGVISNWKWSQSNFPH